MSWSYPKHMCVCVISTSSRGGLPSDVVPTARRIHPPQCLQRHTPIQTPHQPLPEKMLADGCPLDNVDGTATANFKGQFHGCLLASRLAHHSVTPRCWLVLFSFSRLNLQAWKDSINWFSHPKIEIEQRWQVSTPVGHSSGPNTGTAWGRQTGPRVP